MASVFSQQLDEDLVLSGYLALVMGRELMRDETGVIPDIHQNWLAPLWLIKLLGDQL